MAFSSSCKLLLLVQLWRFPFLITLLIIINPTTCAELDGLLELKRAFNNPRALESWKTDNSNGDGGARSSSYCKSWAGITCNNATSTVVAIALPSCCNGGTLTSSALGYLPSLQTLDLSGNNLTGSIPAQICALKNLTVLDLSYNGLTGAIPTDWSNLTSLTTAYLHHNNLSGSIPDGIWRSANLTRLRLEANTLSGSIPAPPSPSLSKLRYFAVESNNLTGAIPSELAMVSSLRYIYASYNQLSGPLPSSLSELRHLKRLQLDHNQLSGPIPASWSNLSSTLITLNLADNNLSGPVPSSLAVKFSASSFANNDQLCGPPLTTPCPLQSIPSSSSSSPSPRPVPPDPHYRRKPSSNPWLAIATPVLGALAIVFVFVIIIFLLYRKRRGRNNRGSEQDSTRMENWFNPDFQADRRKGRLERFSEDVNPSYGYEDFVSRAGYFDTAHVVGKGRFSTVYRSHFPDGTSLAIKVFKYPINTPAFEKEITTLASIKHRHLLPIKGYYSDPVEKAIIYDFYPRGTLHRLLYGFDFSSSSAHEEAMDLSMDSLSLPDWATRQRIAFGVAQALLHLHKNHVLHKDVKSTNILLERDGLLPQLSDYGILHLVGNKSDDPNEAIESAVGYTAPEILAAKKYTEKSDVYSFGVVLLELITGRKPVTFMSDRKRIVLVDWVIGRHTMGRSREVMDATAWKTCPFPEYLDSALNLAIMCVDENPSNRPMMYEVASILEGLASNPSPLKSPDEERFSSFSQ